MISLNKTIVFYSFTDFTLVIYMHIQYTGRMFQLHSLYSRLLHTAGRKMLNISFFLSILAPTQPFLCILCDVILSFYETIKHQSVILAEFYLLNFTTFSMLNF